MEIQGEKDGNKSNGERGRERHFRKMKEREWRKWRMEQLGLEHNINWIITDIVVNHIVPYC